MDMKVGSGGDVTLTMATNGDVVLGFTETDSLTAETVSVSLHPAVLQSMLTKLLGGSSFAAGVVNFAIAEIPTIIASLPSTPVAAVEKAK